MTKHAIERCKQRYGMHLSKQGIEKLRAQVEEGTAILMGSSSPDSKTQKVYMARMGGCVVRFVYDSKTRSIPTVLPHDGSMRLNNRPRRK